MSIRRFALAALASALFAGPALAADTLLNVSYDPTRELYVEFNNAFNKHWQAQGQQGGLAGRAPASFLVGGRLYYSRPTRNDMHMGCATLCA